MKSILDPSFKYTPSAQTDIRKTFARVVATVHTAEGEGVTPVEVHMLQREAAWEAVGMLEALLEAGDLPEYARRDARRLVNKFMGRPSDTTQEEQQC